MMYQFGHRGSYIPDTPTWFLSLEQMLTTTPFFSFHFFLVVIEASSTFSIKRLLKLYVYRFMYHISSAMLTTHESTHITEKNLEIAKMSSSQLLKLLTAFFISLELLAIHCKNT